MPSDTLTPPPQGRLRSLLPIEPELLRGPLGRYLCGTLLGALGMGVTFSLFALYCVDIRHISIIFATSVLTWEAILAVAISPMYGTLVDRFGPSRVLLVCMPVASIALGSLGFAPTLPWIVLVMTVAAAASAGFWGSANVLLTRLIGEEHRTNVFGLNFMLLNVGIGLGSIVGTSIVNLHDLGTFQFVYVLTGTFTLGNAAILYTLRGRGGPPELTEAHEALRGEGWREVLRDKRLMRFLVPSLLLMICGYGSIEAGIPLFATNVEHLPVHAVGLLFFFNTATIVLAQLFVLRGIAKRSRSLLCGVVGAAWGLSWLMATSSLFVGVVAAVSILCAAQIVFALGETIWQPVAPALVNDLAPEHLRGRYNALIGLVFGLSGAVGQSIAGVFLEFHQARLWTIFLACGAVVGGLGTTTLRRVLTAEEDGREPSPVAVDVPAGA